MDLTRITKQTAIKDTILVSIINKQTNQNLKTERATQKIFKLKYLCFILFAFILSQPLVAQYTLQDDDVRITDGVIDSCMYNFEETDIIIPEVLQGQTVLEIADGTTSFDGGAVFSYKGITSVQFPKTIEYIGGRAFRDNNITTLDLSNCVNLEQIVNEAFCRNQISSIDFSGCENLIFIGNNVFRVNNLISVDLTGCDKLSIISLNAFKETGLSSVNITECKSLTFLNYGAFSGNAGLDGLVLPTPEIPGYNLDYWLSSTEEVFDGGDYITSLGYSYEAILSLATYDITYNTNGGTHSNVLEYTMDDTPLTFKDASKAGYMFMGWYDNAEFTGDAITELEKGTYGNIELWAYFVEAYTITYNADGGTHNNPTEYSAEGTPLTLQAATKDGYDFMGWFDNAESTGDAVTEIAEGTTGALEFWASWKSTVGVFNDISDVVSIYPNPVSSNLTINLNNSKVENINILNAIGQQVYTCKPCSTQTSIDFSNFQQGIYYVIIATNDGNQMIEKIIRSN